MKQFDKLYESVINEKKMDIDDLSSSDIFDILEKLVYKTKSRQNHKLGLTSQGEFYFSADGNEAVDRVGRFDNWPTEDEILDINTRGERWDVSRDLYDAIEDKNREVEEILRELIDEVGSIDIKVLLKAL